MTHLSVQLNFFIKSCKVGVYEKRETLFSMLEKTFLLLTGFNVRPSLLLLAVGSIQFCIIQVRSC